MQLFWEFSTYIPYQVAPTLPKTLTTAKQSEEKHISKTWFLSAKSSGTQKYKVQRLEPRVLGSLTGFEVVNFRQAVT